MPSPSNIEREDSWDQRRLLRVEDLLRRVEELEAENAQLRDRLSLETNLAYRDGQRKGQLNPYARITDLPGSSSRQAK